MDQAATRRPRHAQSAEVRAGEFAEIERLWIGSEEELDLSHPSVEGYSSLLMPHRLQIAEISATGERERERGSRVAPRSIDPLGNADTITWLRSDL